MFALVLPSFARSCIAMKFGIAIAARIPMITTTIISSIRVKPFDDLNMVWGPLSVVFRVAFVIALTLDPVSLQPMCQAFELMAADPISHGLKLLSGRAGPAGRRAARHDRAFFDRQACAACVLHEAPRPDAERTLTRRRPPPR